jgi:putative endonuclease
MAAVRQVDVPEAADRVALEQGVGDSVTAKPWAVYLLHCAGGRSYIGISPAPQERFTVHQAGKGAAFTRSNRPLSLAAIVWFDSRSAAASMEVRLKALARPAKLAWFERFTATTASVPATLDLGLASLAGFRRQLLFHAIRHLPEP